MTRNDDPTAWETLRNGAFWFAVLALLATVLSHLVIMECMERDNWCDRIERNEGNR